MDRDALAASRGERIGWRFKGLPAAWEGLTLDEAAASGADLFDDGFTGPLVVLDETALAHNLRAMAEWCAAHGIAHAPHGKTPMSPQLVARQLEHGAWGVSAANAAQLRVFRAFGVSRLQLANQLLDPVALRWLGAELDRDPRFEFCCWVDSVAGVELMTEALAGTTRPVDVLVELGGDGGRTGARGHDAALAVAEAANASPALRVRGVCGYEGALAHDTTEAAKDVVRSYVDELRTLGIALAEGGVVTADEPLIATAGGSAYFDLVAEGLTSGWPDGLAVLPMVRSGAYLTHDDGFYRHMSPLGEHPRVDGMPLRPAFRAWAQVTSSPEPGLALLTLGKRDVSFDEGLPVPLLHRPRQGDVRELTGHDVTKLNDQHAFVALPADSPVAVGDWIGLGLSHPCTIFDKWQLIPVVGANGRTVVDLVRTCF